MTVERDAALSPRTARPAPGPAVTGAPKSDSCRPAFVETFEFEAEVPSCAEVVAGRSVTGAERAGGRAGECDADGADERDPLEEWLLPKLPPPACPPPKPPPPPLAWPPPRWANAAEGANTNTAAAKSPTEILVRGEQLGFVRVMVLPRMPIEATVTIR